jgi:hypothetical protein
MCEEISLFCVLLFYEDAWVREENRPRVFENRVLRGYVGLRQRK